MWFVHDKSDEVRSPTYLNVSTVSRTEPLSDMGMVGDNGDLLRETCMTLHLASLDNMKLEVAQVWIALTSLCRATKSAADAIGR